MKTLPAILLLMVMSVSVKAQHEFSLHENNLIYDASTMQRLGVIVDSLNLKFRTCDLSHPYYSLPQGTAAYVFFDTNLSEAEAAIRKGVSLEELITRFTPLKIMRGVRIVRSSYSSRNDKMVVYQVLPPSYNDDIQDVTLAYTSENVKTHGWVSHCNSAYLWAFYLDGLESHEIPHDYARLVQYVDCMIDTTARIYLPDASASHGYVDFGKNSDEERFLRWANDYPGKPAAVKWRMSRDPTDKDFAKQQQVYERYHRAYRTWDSLRLADLDIRMNKSGQWLLTLQQITEDAVKNGSASEPLEFYIARYISPELALELKRRRRVIGMCSMDQSPRLHAMNICMLAAQTAQWDIFLRSHLDIMNDRFERVSDGSWAWRHRQTYLKELEALDINAADLLLGTILRTTSVSDNHYFGDVTRIGRGLAETSEPDAVEARVLKMITDTKLDLFNRVLIGYVFGNYNYHLKDQGRKERNWARLREATATLPEEVRKRLEVER